MVPIDGLWEADPSPSLWRADSVFQASLFVLTPVTAHTLPVPSVLLSALLALSSPAPPALPSSSCAGVCFLGTAGSWLVEEEADKGKVWEAWRIKSDREGLGHDRRQVHPQCRGMVLRAQPGTWGPGVALGAVGRCCGHTLG